MKILILQHVPHESTGYIGEYAKEKGISIDVIEFWQPYFIPALQEYSGIIIMGGPMGVYEDFPSKNDEIALIQKAVGKIPILGICLGSQLLAHALGAKVYPNPGGKEIGYYDVELTEAGKRSDILKGFPKHIKALEWHGDMFKLPQGATLLASTPLCANQAFSFKNAHGVLFHLEFTPEMVQNLVKTDHEWTHKDFDLNETKLMSETDEIAGLMKQQSYLLLDNFLR